jgi:hypothetical protein
MLYCCASISVHVLTHNLFEQQKRVWWWRTSRLSYTYIWAWYRHKFIPTCQSNGQQSDFSNRSLFLLQIPNSNVSHCCWQHFVLPSSYQVTKLLPLNLRTKAFWSFENAFQKIRNFKQRSQRKPLDIRLGASSGFLEINMIPRTLVLEFLNQQIFFRKTCFQFLYDLPKQKCLKVPYLFPHDHQQVLWIQCSLVLHVTELLPPDFPRRFIQYRNYR